MPGELCALCRSQAAWSEASAGTLRIDHQAIADAETRRAGELAGVPLWRRALAYWPAALTMALAVGCGLALRALLAARAIGPLADLVHDLRSTSRTATLVGATALVAGVVALVRLRRHRTFRRVPVIAAHASAIAAGTVALAIGGFHWWGYAGGFGWRYTSMPPRTPMPVSTTVDRILAATVVVLAPGADGDARELALGTGAIVAVDPARAWVVTCSHVAMPYVSPGAPRHAAKAQPVWIQLSDGRQGRGRVRWAAPPPLDVVLIELPMTDAPAPVTISKDADALQEGAAVTFVPNPYREGWLVRNGTLLRRERHTTPAGVYDLLYTDLFVIPGDSGSGLYDSRGQLVGLNTWTKRTADGAAEGISLPSDTMRALVDAIEAGRLDQLDDTAPAEHP